MRRHRYDLDKQGILVESLDGRTILAQLNPATPLNPASVMKLATTLVALARLGPDYRFVTRVYGDAPIDRKKTNRCPAISIWSATGIPFSGRSDLYRLARSLRRRGLRRVTGDLVVAGPFSVNSSNNPKVPVRYLARYLAASRHQDSGANPRRAERVY